MSARKGKIRRKGYHRKAYTRADGVRVKAAYVGPTWVKDMGAKGKTPKSRRVLPHLKKGAMEKYGYKVKANERSRRVAIGKAMKDKGGLSTIRHLVVLRTYNKNSPYYSRLNKDVEYAQEKYKKQRSRR